MPPRSDEYKFGWDTKTDLDFKVYYHALLDRRKTLLACVISVTLLALIYSLVATPIYQGRCMIEIERQGPEVFTFQDVNSIDPSGYRSFYQSQYETLNSRSVKVLAIERVDLLNNTDFLNRKATPLKRIRAFIHQRIFQSKRETSPIDHAVRFVQDNLTIQPIRHSQHVIIAFEDRSPELARDLATAIAIAYQQFNSNTRYKTTDQASEFLTKDVALQQSRITELEEHLQEYGRTKQLYALGDGVQDISEQALADQNGRLSEAMGRLALSKARYETVGRAAPDALSEVLESPLVRNLKEQYATVERKYSQLAKKYKPEWPALIELKEELDTTASRLQLETEAIAAQVRETAFADYEQSLAEVENLTMQVEKQKVEVKRVSLDAITYSTLKSEIETERQVLNSLIKRRSETGTSTRLQGTETSNIRIIDRAVRPDIPVRPRKLFNLALGLVLGLGLGVGVVIVLHYVDNSIKNEKDVAQYVPGLAVLGYIPNLEAGDDITNQNWRKYIAGKPAPVTSARSQSADTICHDAPQSTSAEALRNLRTSLLLSSPDRPPKCLAVTSSNPSEGKSTICINLAIVLAQQGKKVLLVDADLRKPRIHKALGLDNGVGLSSYLSGNAGAEDLIQSSFIPDLDIITSGPIPPNPSELISAPLMQELLISLNQTLGYDHVLFDSPPALQVPDAVILTTKLDGAVLVVSAGETPRESLQMATSRFRQGRGHLFGCILNGVQERAGYYRGYKYNYNHKPNRDQAKLKQSS